MTIGCLLFWFLIIGHRLILYSTKNGTCSALAGFYAGFDNYLEVVVTAMFPPIVTSVLAWRLIRSVRDVIYRQITPANSQVVGRRTVLQQMDSQLTLMLILQSMLTIITYAPYAAELIYTNVTRNWYKSSLQIAQEKVFVEFIHLVSYVFFASSFYVSMVSNSGFRRQFKNFFRGRKGRDTTDATQTTARAGGTKSIHP